MNPIFQVTPPTKALLVSAVFSIAGAAGAYGAQAYWPAILPLVVFYIVLTINSYFSIRLFSAITPPDDKVQQFIDAILFGIYIFLACAFAVLDLFFLGVLFLFIIAPLKYALLLGKIPHLKLLKKKIIIDLLGTLMAVAVVVGSLAGYSTESAWALAIIFAIANIYFLLINPMYKIID
ncbi:hypothetical protein H7X87_04350 [Acetobacteraceae bacterium]|nr:hypothetical protein [Candidatus Parcubacteria bacterium]